jgi:hypothetical protein
MDLIGLFVRIEFNMSYMIKHPINANTFKIATTYNSTDFVFSAGQTPRSVTIPLNTLVQTSGMGLTLATNQITLVAGKTYLIYYKVGLSNSTENRAGQVVIQKNGITISTQPIVNAVTTSSTIGNGAWISPINIVTAVVSASIGDYISFLYTRTAGNVYADTISSGASRAFILEIA